MEVNPTRIPIHTEKGIMRIVSTYVLLYLPFQAAGLSGAAWTGTSSKHGYRPHIMPSGWAQGGDPLTFVHEVGHILGAKHNREEEGTESLANEARYGYLMKGSSVKKQKWNQENVWHEVETDGKLTIMSYWDKERVYTNKIAYFSKNQQVPGKNYAFGDGSNNNVDQITRAAPILAEVGDESCIDQCGSNVRCETCRDADKRGESFCKKNKVECKFQEWFREDSCRKTCGTCKPSGGELF